MEVINIHVFLPTLIC